MRNLLGTNGQGFIKLSAKDIVEQCNGVLEMNIFDEKMLSAKEGVKYYSGAVQRGFEIATKLAPQIRDIKRDKNLKKTEIERLVNKLIHDSTETEQQRRVAEMVIRAGKNYTVAVLVKTSVVVNVKANDDGSYTSHAYYKQSYLDNEKLESTILVETPIFINKVGQGQIRITNEELDVCIPEKLEKLYNTISKLLNDFNDVRIATNGNYEACIENYIERTNKDIELKSQFVNMIEDGTII